MAVVSGLAMAGIAAAAGVAGSVMAVQQAKKQEKAQREAIAQQEREARKAANLRRNQGALTREDPNAEVVLGTSSTDTAGSGKKKSSALPRVSAASQLGGL